MENEYTPREEERFNFNEAKKSANDFLSQVKVKMIPFEAYVLEKYNATTEREEAKPTHGAETMWDHFGIAMATLAQTSGLVVPGEEPDFSTESVLEALLLEMMRNPYVIFERLEEFFREVYG